MLNLSVVATESIMQGSVDRTREVLASLSELHGGAPWFVADQLSEISRVVAALKDDALLTSLLERTPSAALRHELGRRSSQAILAEMRNRWQESFDRFRDAAAGWRGYGSIVEEAHALFGVSRSAAALGLDDEADKALQRAGELIAPLNAPNFTAVLRHEYLEPFTRRPSASG